MDSVVDSRLGLNPLAVGVLDLVYFAYRVGKLDHLGVGVATGENEMQERRLVAQDIQYLSQVHQLQFQGVVDLVKDGYWVLFPSVHAKGHILQTMNCHL